MSLSKGTAQAIVPRRTDGPLTVSLSTDKVDGGSAGSTPPERSLTAKPSSEAVHDLVTKGNVSRSNSMQDIQHVQHELKSAGELVFATDAGSSPTLKGGNFLKLVEWMLASASPEERALQNFVLAYRQWKPPAELWRIVMDKYVSRVMPHVARAHSMVSGLMLKRRPTNRIFIASGTWQTYSPSSRNGKDRHVRAGVGRPVPRSRFLFTEGAWASV